MINWEIKHSMQDTKIKWIYDPKSENSLYIMHNHL